MSTSLPAMTNPLETSADCVGSCQGCASVGSCSDRVVCKCLKVTEDQVIHAITVHGARTLVELRMLTEAGSGCTCCHRELRAYLAVYASSPSSSPSPAICSAR
jgi:bacterioferritin-associated ferredoxin